jgi:hypothetical protein
MEDGRDEAEDEEPCDPATGRLRRALQDPVTYAIIGAARKCKVLSGI